MIRNHFHLSYQRKFKRINGLAFTPVYQSK